MEDDVSFLFLANDANIALDNIQIVVAENVSNSVRFGAIDGTTLILDSEIDHGFDVSYDGDQCTVIYNDRLSNDSSMISRMMIVCQSFDAEDVDFNEQHTLDSTATAFVDHFSATTLWVLPGSSSYFPGMNMVLNLTVTDRLGNVIEDEVMQNTIITMEASSFVSVLSVDENGHCEICEEGVWLSAISMDDNYDDEYTLQITMDNDQFVLGQSEFVLYITGCPVGYGVDSDNYTCDICNVGEYNIEDVSVRECSSCHLDLNPGIECDDGHVVVSVDYWMGFNDDDSIKSSACPSSMCCQQERGCDYIDDAESLCAPYRDSNSILCGKCLDGFSESMNSVNCTKCDRTMYWEYIVLSLCIAMIITAIELFTNREKRDSFLKRKKANRQILKIKGRSFMGTVAGVTKRLKTGDNKITLSTLCSIAVYYWQAVSQIVDPAVASFGTAFAALFDVSVQRVSEGVTADGNDWCFTDGLDAVSKILLDLISPLWVCLFLSTLFVISRYVIRRPIKIKKKTVNFEAVGLSVFLLIVGKILDTLFRCLSCRSVGSKMVHFYFGDWLCFGAIWIVAVTVLVLLIVVFGAVFVYGFTLTENQRADPNTFIFKLCDQFKPELWFWEYVIFIRRIVIALFAVGLPNEATFQLIFMALILICIYIQWRVAPFVSTTTNHVELILLCALPLVIMAQSHSAQSITSFIPLLLSMMILMPIPLVAGFGAVVVWREWKQWTKDHDVNNKRDPDISRNRVLSLSSSEVSTGAIHVEMRSNSDVTKLETGQTEGGASDPQKQHDAAESMVEMTETQQKTEQEAE